MPYYEGYSYCRTVVSCVSWDVVCCVTVPSGGTEATGGTIPFEVAGTGGTAVVAGGATVVVVEVVVVSWVSDASRNSLILFPSALPTCGSFPAPKMTSTITKINISSVGPIGIK